jgi:hypothetical protein
MTNSTFPQFFGFYFDLGSLNYSPISSNSLNSIRTNFHFIVRREKEDDWGGNFLYVNTILNSNLQNMNLESQGWKMSSRIESNSAFNPSFQKVKIEDKDGEKISITCNDASIKGVIELWTKFVNISKKHKSSLTYKLIKENKQLSEEIERLKKLLNKN